MLFRSLVKIREVARQPLPPLVKLRLMENEDNLFDLGLYVGIAGTATALVLQVLGGHGPLTPIAATRSVGWPSPTGRPHRASRSTSRSTCCSARASRSTSASR